MLDTLQRSPRFAELDAAILNSAETDAAIDHGRTPVRVTTSGDVSERIPTALPRSRVRVQPGRIHPCWHCHAPDGRDASHARGCPKLAPVPEADVQRMLREVLQGWGVRIAS